MKIFKNKEEIYNHFNKEVEASGPTFNQHFSKYNYFSNNKIPTKQGQFFLFELSKNGFVSKPKLGIYMNMIPVDQTICLEWVNYRSNSEYNFAYNTGKDIKILGERSTIVNSFILLNNDSIMIYECWDSFPGWKKLKLAYSKTWYYHKTISEIRNIQINNILR